MSIIQIEIIDNNDFNKGWLMYLLGLDRPTVTDDDGGNPESVQANGWDMGKETGELKQVRHVFTRQHDIDHPAYVVREVKANPPDPLMLVIDGEGAITQVEEPVAPVKRKVVVE